MLLPSSSNRPAVDFTIGASEQPPTLLCAPFALHGAVVTDLTAGHSLVATLQEAGLRRLLVTDWRSAASDMRFLDIDDYLADLNVLVDAIGAPVDLIGLCQGGRMSLVYAARFPGKVRKLVLAGAPIDTAAAPSALSALVESSPLTVYRELVRLGNGLLPGRNVLNFGDRARLTGGYRAALTNRSGNRLARLRASQIGIRKLEFTHR